MVGIGGVVFSFMFGDLCAVYLLPTFFKHFEYLGKMPLAQAWMDAAPMYMGIMSTATSVGITARILSERKKMDSEEGVSIMAGAVIDDVLGLIVLAIGNGIIAATVAAKASATGEAAGVQWGAIGMVAVKAFAVWLGATLVGVLAARKISWLLKLFKNPQAIATLAFGLALILAGFFEYMGLAMIIGAYVTGLALSRTDLKHMIQEVLAPVYTFLVPIFFCVMGMMVDCSALMSKPVIYFGIIYTVLAVFAKVIGCALPSLFCGFNILGSLRIGAGMVPRGEVALIIAGLGLSSGYLTQEIFGIGILMTLITTVVAPPALIALFKPESKGVRHPKESMIDSRQIMFELPDSQVAKIMLRKLVNEFRREGFYAIQYAHEVNFAIWEVSMNEMELTFQRNGNKIRVECNPAEEAVVNQAWMEVVSQINLLSKVISKPVMKKSNMKELIKKTETEKTGKCSEASSIVENFLMVPSFKAHSKKEAIEKLCEMVQAKFPTSVTDLVAVKEAVLMREESMPTGLDNGVAVPHGRSDGVNHIMGAVALVDNSENENGIIPDWETIDHSKIQLIVLTLVPESTQGPYLQVMAYISHAVHSNDGLNELLKCKTEDEMCAYFHNMR